MGQLIAPLDILTSGGKYPERERDARCTSEVRMRAADLAERVSKLLEEVRFKPKVSSGLRFPETLANDVARSAHFTGEAVDLTDPDQVISEAILDRPDLLVKYDLYMENPRYTKTWVHLQSRPTRSGNRVFVP